MSVPQPDTGRDPLKTAREEIEDNHAPDDALHDPELCKACEGLRELDAIAARLAEAEARTAGLEEYLRDHRRLALGAALDESERRVATLEAALTRIAAIGDPVQGTGFSSAAQEIARAALNPVPSQPAQPDEQAALTGEDPQADREKVS